MTTVLVTGPIGGGKSTVCRILELADYPVYDCDARCKALYDEVPGLRKQIEKELEIPFRELGRIFCNNALREKLEAIVYPLLIKDIEAWKASQSAQLVFIESAVALEKPAFHALWDKVLMVTAPLEQRLSRNPRTAERDALQHFDNKLIDYTICNDSDLVSLHSKVDNFLETL